MDDFFTRIVCENVIQRKRKEWLKTKFGSMTHSHFDLNLAGKVLTVKELDEKTLSDLNAYLFSVNFEEFRSLFEKLASVLDGNSWKATLLGLDFVTVEIIAQK